MLATGCSTISQQKSADPVASLTKRSVARVIVQRGRTRLNDENAMFATVMTTKPQ